MGGKRTPLKSDKFDRDAVHDNGLKCPFLDDDADEATRKLCHAEDGWEMGRLRYASIMQRAENRANKNTSSQGAYTTSPWVLLRLLRVWRLVALE